MSVVVAAPAAIRDLSLVVADLASVAGDHVPRLEAALVRAASSGSERLRLDITLADDLRAEATDLDDTAHDLRAFAFALYRVDADGVGVPGTRHGVGPGALVVVDDAVFRPYAEIDVLPTVEQFVVELRRQLAELDDVEGLDDDERDHRREVLERTIAQLATLGAGRLPGFGAVGDEEFSTGLMLMLAVAATRERIDPGIPEELRADSTASEWDRVRAAAELAERGRPFLADALLHDVIITPARLEFLNQLDAFASMPIADFVAAAERAQDDFPWFDWSTDGCSGPVPEAGQIHCLRHDFLYRNTRMLRDQWGLDEDFGLFVKDFADDTLGRDVRRSTDGIRNELWGFVVELAVEVRGSVRTPWEPGD